MEYVSLTFETDLEDTQEGWAVGGEFILEDIQRGRGIDFQFLEGRTIDHIEINKNNDFEIVFALKEEYDDVIHPPELENIFPDNIFEI